MAEDQDPGGPVAGTPAALVRHENIARVVDPHGERVPELGVIGDGPVRAGRVGSEIGLAENNVGGGRGGRPGNVRQVRKTEDPVVPAVGHPQVAPLVDRHSALRGDEIAEPLREEQAGGAGNGKPLVEFIMGKIRLAPFARGRFAHISGPVVTHDPVVVEVGHVEIALAVHIHVADVPFLRRGLVVGPGDAQARGVGHGIEGIVLEVRVAVAGGEVKAGLAQHESGPHAAGDGAVEVDRQDPAVEAVEDVQNIMDLVHHRAIGFINRPGAGLVAHDVAKGVVGVMDRIGVGMAENDIRPKVPGDAAGHRRRGLGLQAQRDQPEESEGGKDV